MIRRSVTVEPRSAATSAWGHILWTDLVAYTSHKTRPVSEELRLIAMLCWMSRYIAIKYMLLMSTVQVARNREQRTENETIRIQ
jgi:hypothetical protein